VNPSTNVLSPFCSIPITEGRRHTVTLKEITFINMMSCGVSTAELRNDFRKDKTTLPKVAERTGNQN
jgi:hypothetical protein